MATKIIVFGVFFLKQKKNQTHRNNIILGVFSIYSEFAANVDALMINSCKRFKSKLSVWKYAWCMDWGLNRPTCPHRSRAATHNIIWLPSSQHFLILVLAIVPTTRWAFKCLEYSPAVWLMISTLNRMDGCKISAREKKIKKVPGYFGTAHITFYR